MIHIDIDHIATLVEQTIGQRPASTPMVIRRALYLASERAYDNALCDALAHVKDAAELAIALAEAVRVS